MKIYIPTKKEKHPGLFPFCSKCNKILTKNNIAKCNHEENQRYRVITRNPFSGKQVSRLLDSKDYIDAVREATEFKRSVLQVNNQPEIIVDEKPLILFLAIAKYIDFLKDKGVPKHKKKNRGPAYARSQKSLLLDFARFLKGIGKNMNQYKITDIDDNIVGEYYDFLDDKYDNPATFNHHLKSLRTFYNALVNKMNYNINKTNPFNDITAKDYYPEKIVIEKEELEEILAVIHPNNGLQILPSHHKDYRLHKKNHYFPWLKHAILIGLYAGRREDELICMKFSDIEVDADGVPEILNYVDQKPEKLKGKSLKLNSNEVPIVTIPIFKQFRDLIYELGFEKHKNTDRFLIAPELNSGRDELAHRMSRAFTYYKKQTGIKNHITFKSLRKANLTAHEEYAIKNGSIYADFMVRMISDHKSNAVLQNHYINQKLISRIIAKSDFRIF